MPRSLTNAILLNLAVVALAVLVLAHQAAELEDQLRIERDRRRVAEQNAMQREKDLDGALGTIHDLTSTEEPEAADDA